MPPKVRTRNPAWTQGRSKEEYPKLNSSCNDILPGNNNLISYTLNQVEASLCFQEGECCWGSWKQQKAAVLHFFTSLYEPQGFKLSSLMTELSFYEQDPYIKPSLQNSDKVHILEKPAPRLVVSSASQRRDNLDSSATSDIHSSILGNRENRGGWRYSSFWKGYGQRFTTAIWDWRADPVYSPSEDIGNLHGGILISHNAQPIYIRCRLEGRLISPSTSLWQTTRRILRFGQVKNDDYRCFRLTPRADQHSDLEHTAAELDDKVVGLIFNTSEKQLSNRWTSADPTLLALGEQKEFNSREDIVNQDITLEASKAFSHSDYHVAIICALPKELFAVRSLFDQRHPNIAVPKHDTNHYAFGTISGHTIVAASLPSGVYGTCSAANVASQLKCSFANIRFCLLVGIGGGIPSQQRDIRLGDVVVSHPSGLLPGVIKYDLGKAMENGVFQRTGALPIPPYFLLSAISDLNSDPDLDTEPLKPYLEAIAAHRPEYRFPGYHADTLFVSDYSHVKSDGQGNSCKNCKGQLAPRFPRRNTQPVIHYGVIASGDRVMTSAQLRDEVAEKYDALCFEMEAAGVAGIMPCLTIRGICDYSDSHKNEIWQEYASATAAAYAKVLLSHVRTLL